MKHLGNPRVKTDTFKLVVFTIKPFTVIGHACIHEVKRSGVKTEDMNHNECIYSFLCCSKFYVVGFWFLAAHNVQQDNIDKLARMLNSYAGHVVENLLFA